MSVTNFSSLLRTSMDAAKAAHIEATLQLPADIVVELGAHVSRRVLAMALNAILFHDLLQRVPSGATYVAEKDRIEVSSCGRIRQTALRADPVRRPLRAAHGSAMEMDVPGSFFEFISRSPLRAGSDELDLGFDSGNAQGIFRMTEAVAS